MFLKSVGRHAFTAIDIWAVEVNSRARKVAPGTEMLQAKSVNVVGKEIVMHPVACHLNPSAVRRL